MDREALTAREHEPTPRPMILAFAVQMERELQANDGKGEWSNWQPSGLEILGEMEHHFDKLKLVLAACDSDPASDASQRASEFAADIANFSMKAWELYGS
jgi:hypothetical protein